jgi:hypothetical protein
MAQEAACCNTTATLSFHLGHAANEKVDFKEHLTVVPFIIGTALQIQTEREKLFDNSASVTP